MNQRENALHSKTSETWILSTNKIKGWSGFSWDFKMKTLRFKTSGVSVEMTCSNSGYCFVQFNTIAPNISKSKTTFNMEKRQIAHQNSLQLIDCKNKLQSEHFKVRKFTYSSVVTFKKQQGLLHGHWSWGKLRNRACNQEAQLDVFTAPRPRFSPER